MSGHSKWKNIAHKKGAMDAQRGKIFTKTAREMAVAIKEGGVDPATNTRLKDIIAKAKASNVPNDNINRILQKYQSGNVSETYEEIVYEGYGPQGVAVVVETLTDNRNRTAADVRHYFDKFGGNLGQTGCVAWQFESRGILVIERAGQEEDAVMIQALELGAMDMETSDEVFEIYTEPTQLATVRDGLEQLSYSFLEAEVGRVPQNYVTLTEETDIKNMQRLLDMLEDNDDVQNVFHNWEEI